jgi:hypothetical protein
MLAVLNTLVLSLMDLHQVANVARQIRRFVSHLDEALLGPSTFEKLCDLTMLTRNYLEVKQF